MEKGTYKLIDIRDELSFEYGHLPEAVSMPMEDLVNHIDEFKEKKVILYCKKGELSLTATEELRNSGIEAYSLKGGYLAWLISSMDEDKTSTLGSGTIKIVYI